VIPIRDSIPTRRFPLVTVAIIAANAGVWLTYQVPHLRRSIEVLGFQPCVVDHACPDRGVPWPLDVVSAMFAHGGWLHIVGNMLFLWIFGNNVEDAMGRARYLVFYLAAGFAAMALQAWVTLTVGSDAQAAVPNVGASGAIAGVLGAYFVLFPLARVIALVPLLVFLLPVEAPAVLFLGLWFLLQLWEGGFSLVAPGAGGGVAFFAHIGGFAFGLLAVRLFAAHRRPRIAGPW
jgi:membrane associated rhomboid family serine protease